MTLPAGFIDSLRAIVGERGLVLGVADQEPYLREERGLYHGATPAVVRPVSTREVAEVVKLCAGSGVGVVPQGGNTGLCGGAVARGEIVLSLGRLNHIRVIDRANHTLTVEAGCILKTVQEAATELDCLFPLSLGAEGSCQIGGNISTNAGGTAVLRYGNMRELVLGLEVVLPDGRVWDGLRGLRKDNTGYDLKQLFIGSEGTLGVITAAVVKLFPRPRARETALAALPTVAAVQVLFGRVRDALGDSLTGFELIPRIGVEMATRHVPGVADPFQGPHPWYALIELSSPHQGGALREGLEGVLAAAFDDGSMTDAVIAESEAQRNDLWRLRESLPEAQKHEGGSIKHDVAVPVSRVAEFIERATVLVEAALPGVRPVPFGHMGDGNIHFNLSQPAGADKESYLAEWGRMNRIVHDLVAGMGGSISAEHGVGILKREEIAHYKGAIEIDLMRTLKKALDPQNILNPGKVVET